MSRIQRLLFEICLDSGYFFGNFFSRNMTYHSTALKGDVRLIKLKINIRPMHKGKYNLLT